MPSPAPSLDWIPAAGTLLAGKYRVERLLGAGGMGVVLIARHIPLNERVAIKLLRRDRGSSQAQHARFVREARAASGLRSEHVVRVFDLGLLADGFPYIAMELLHGTDLASLLGRTGPLAIPDAVDYVLQACEGVAEAHARGIIHRDLKPANLFLTRRTDGSPCVKVLDFGVSKVKAAATPSHGTDEEARTPRASMDQTLAETDEDLLSNERVAGDADPSLTRTRGHLGSPHYMSPEQMRSARDVDVRADVWSLGTILYELLLGVPPFDAPSYDELRFQIANREPRAPREARADVAEELERAILRALRKNPFERFASVSELAEALAPFGSPQAVTRAERTARILLGGVSASGEARVDALAPTPDATPHPHSDSQRRRASPRALTWVIGGLLLTGIGGLVWRQIVRGGASSRSAPSSERMPDSGLSERTAPAVALHLIPGTRQTRRWSFDVAPDGSRLVYGDGESVALQDLPTGSRTSLPIPREVAARILQIAFVGKDAIAYVVTAPGAPTTELWRFGLRDEKPVRVRADALTVDYAAISPDGESIAYAQGGRILVATTAGPLNPIREGDQVLSLRWSPDSRSLASLSQRVVGKVDLVWMRADGSSPTLLMGEAPLIGTFGRRGLTFVTSDTLLVLRYSKSETSLVEVRCATGDAGATRTIQTWTDADIDGTSTGGGRTVVSIASRNGSLVRFTRSAAEAQEFSGERHPLMKTSGTVLPVGWIDNGRIAVEDVGASALMSLSLDGAWTTLAKDELARHPFFPNVIHSQDGSGLCYAIRSSPGDSTTPSPGSAVTCPLEVRCGRTRCVADEMTESGAHTFREWQAESGTPGRVLARVTGRAAVADLSQDGEWLAISSPDLGIEVHDLAHGVTRRTPSPLAHVAGVALLPGDGGLIAVGFENRRGPLDFVIGEIDHDGRWHVIESDPATLSAFPCVSPDGRSFVVGQVDFESFLWLLAEP